MKENITNSNENNAILNPADHLSIIGLVNAQHQAILKDPTYINNITTELTTKFPTGIIWINFMGIFQQFSWTRNFRL